MSVDEADRAWSKLNKRDELSLIGAIAVGWSGIELFMEYAIWGFLDLDERRGRLLTHALPAMRRIELLRDLSRNLDEFGRERLKRCLDVIEDLRKERNTVVHGMWFQLHDDEQTPVVVRHNKKKDSDEIVFTKEDLANLGYAMHNATLAFLSFLRDHEVWPRDMAK